LEQTATLFPVAVPVITACEKFEKDFAIADIFNSPEVSPMVSLESGNEVKKIIVFNTLAVGSYFLFQVSILDCILFTYLREFICVSVGLGDGE
jgi:hypothetical protein